MVGRFSLADVAQGRYKVGKALERRNEMVGRPVEWGRYVRKESRSETWGWGGSTTTTLVNCGCWLIWSVPDNNSDVETGYKKKHHDGFR